jgi:diaminohydroxyphosphoribosylaminopyrimidine deaminase / 5-amino-6-(5-phosphoribosylamino)uracil reductase
MARRGLGTTWPNPSVGCIVVRHGRVVGRGVTSPGGRPHAEPVALAMAGEQARGATAYVTLEPCCHWGRSPPCTEALIEAGIARVVIGTRDPDPRVDGQGVAMLRAAGIVVDEGILEDECRETLSGFIQRVTAGRPLVTLKLATTLDGRIATSGGESQWITGTPARRLAHALRGRNDAVMVGVGTVLADNPELTCRIPGFRSTPVVRIVADSHLRTPLTSRLAATTAEIPTWFLIRPGTDPARHHACWSRAEARSPPRCCVPTWWTELPGSTPPLSWAAMAGPACRHSAWTNLTSCRFSGAIVNFQSATTCSANTRGKAHVHRHHNCSG